MSEGERAGQAYGAEFIQILPDMRVTHSDPLMPGENFSNVPGEVIIVHYNVDFPSAGRYYVWVRCFSTGTEDNGVHVGFDGIWPESGARMQWCEGKNKWTWDTRQRTEEVHCGVFGQIWLDIPSAGVHDIQFSMREDGFAMDRFVLSKELNVSDKLNNNNN